VACDSGVAAEEEKELVGNVVRIRRRYLASRPNSQVLLSACICALTTINYVQACTASEVVISRIVIWMQMKQSCNK
jgi:hypothetical protein